MHNGKVSKRDGGYEQGSNKAISTAKAPHSNVAIVRARNDLIFAKGETSDCAAMTNQSSHAPPFLTHPNLKMTKKSNEQPCHAIHANTNGKRISP